MKWNGGGHTSGLNIVGQRCFCSIQKSPVIVIIFWNIQHTHLSKLYTVNNWIVCYCHSDLKKINISLPNIFQNCCKIKLQASHGEVPTEEHFCVYETTWLICKDCKTQNDPDTVITLFSLCPHYLFFYSSYMTQSVVRFSLLLERYARKGQESEYCTLHFLCKHTYFSRTIIFNIGHPKCVIGSAKLDNL